MNQQTHEEIDTFRNSSSCIFTKPYTQASERHASTSPTKAVSPRKPIAENGAVAAIS